MPLDRSNAVDPSGHDFLCRGCSSPLIQVVDWAPSSDEVCSVLVRCPECFQSYELVLDEDGAYEFSLVLDEALQCLLEIAEWLDQDIFRQSSVAFTRALRTGQVWPADF